MSDATDPTASSGGEAEVANPVEARRTKRIFIVGSRRSGTTWMAMLLGQNPGVVVLQQSSFFVRLFHLLEGLAMDSNLGMTVLTLSDDTEEAAGLSRRKVRDLYALERYREQLAPLAEDFYRQFEGCHPNALALVDQQPENIRHWHHILALFPDVWFLHIIRDPRAVFASYLHAGRSWATRDHFTCDPLEFASEWISDLKTGREIAAATDRVVQVRFEALRENGPDELQRLYAELGLPAEAEHCRRAIEACSLEKLRESSHGPLGFFRRGEVAGWRSELAKRNIAAVEYSCGHFMDELGYERVHPSFSRPPWSVRMWRLRRQMRNAGHDWMHDGKGWFHRASRSVARALPPLRKLGHKLFGG